MLTQLKKGYEKLSAVDLFSPAVFFPFVLFCYHLFGNLFDHSRSDVFGLKYSTYPLIIVALLVYYIVYYFVNKKNVMLPSVSMPWFSKLFYIGVSALTVVGLLSLIYLFSTGQIGILDESIRRNINPKLNFLSAFCWFGYLILVTEYITKKQLTQKAAIKVIVLTSIFVLAFYVLIGYRTNLFMIVFTLVLFFHYSFRRFSFRVVAIMLIVVSVAFSAFGHMRVANEDKTVAFNKAPSQPVKLDHKTKTAIAKTKEMPEWFKTVTAEFVNGKIVLGRIIEYTHTNGTMRGELHLSAIKTVLPGENLSPRTIVTDKVNHFSENGIPVTREGRTTTPSLLGQLFLDGGYILLVIGIGLISFLLTAIYNRLKATGQSHYKISYAFITTLLVISVHTGLLDVIFFIFFIGMLLYSLINKNNTGNIIK